MATIKKFEDLRVWQGAREIVRSIYSLTAQTPFNQDAALKDQVRRASISIMSNIAEGFGSGSDADFVRFLGIARRSLLEVQSQCYAALDLAYMTTTEFTELYEKTVTLKKELNALIAYLARTRRKPRTIKEPRSDYQASIPTSFHADPSDPLDPLDPSDP